jgi:hypothetical protein
MTLMAPINATEIWLLISVNPCNQRHLRAISPGPGLARAGQSR